MLIKTRLYTSSALMVTLAALVMLLAVGSLSSLSEHLQKVSEQANQSASLAEGAADSATLAADKAATSNQNILQIVDGIEQTNQKAKLTSKKVKEISASLIEVTELIEELSEDVVDEEALAILEEVNDEISDIEERTRREALINLVDSSKSVAEFSQQIKREAEQISALNGDIAQQVIRSNDAASSSQNIAAESNALLEEIGWKQTLIVSALLLLVAVAIVSGLLMIRAVVKPISETVELMEDIAQGEGDLTRRLTVKGKDEMALIGNAFNRFVEKVQQLLGELTQSTQALQQTSTDTLNDMSGSCSTVLDQQQKIEQIASAIERMNATSHSVATSAQEAAHATSSANQKVVISKDTVTESQQSVSALVTQVQEAVDVIDRLNGKSQDINTMVDVISGVAEQTSLLALNAAIEAARAGEQGRGFAVVADEVRALASKAESSTQEIRHVVEDIQQMTAQAVEVMRTSQKSCDGSVASAEKTVAALDDILSSISTIDAMNTQIADAAQQESKVTEETNQRISEVNNQSINTSESVESAVQACQRLNQITEQVYQQLGQFKI